MRLIVLSSRRVSYRPDARRCRVTRQKERKEIERAQRPRACIHPSKKPAPYVCSINQTPEPHSTSHFSPFHTMPYHPNMSQPEPLESGFIPVSQYCHYNPSISHLIIFHFPPINHYSHHRPTPPPPPPYSTAHTDSKTPPFQSPPDNSTHLTISSDAD